MEQMTCRVCGDDMWVSTEGTSHHWGNGAEYIDHDRDADHVAVPPDPDAPL